MSAYSDAINEKLVEQIEEQFLGLMVNQKSLTKNNKTIPNSIYFLRRDN